MIKRSLSVILTVLAVLFSAVPAYAEQDACAYIRVTYSSDIKPQSGDIFEMTYKYTGGVSKAKIKVDGSQVSSELGVIAASKGSYQITDIKYTGPNKQIKEQGYACTSSFTSAVKTGSTIRITVGSKATKDFTDLYSDAIVVAGTKKNTSSEKSESDSSSSEQTSDSTSDQDADTADQDTADEKKDSKSAEDADIEYYSKKTKSSSSDSAPSIIIRLVPLAIFLIFVIAVIYFLHSRGIL